METTQYKSIPYPSENEDPFVDSFDQLMGYLDRNLETRYSPVYGVTPFSSQFIYFPVGETADHRAAAGCPIRYRELDFDPWKYGVIRVWNAEWGVAQIAGAPVSMSDTQFEIGGPSMVVTRRMHFDGNWNHDPATALFYTDKKGKFQWGGPSACLVMASVTTADENHDSTEDYVNIVRSPAGSPYVGTYGPWAKVFNDNGGQGVAVFRFGWNHNVEANVAQYEFGHRNYGGAGVFDVSVVSTGPQDAAGLSVELVFVLKGDQDQVCPGASPSVQLTISGMPGGEDWQGLTDGVHTLCPTDYSHFNNGTNYAIEVWVDRGWYYGPDFGDDLSIRAINRWTTDVSSRMQLKWRRGSLNWQYTYKPTYGTTGAIRNRLFRTFVLGPTTFTLARGAGQWQYAPP